MDKCETTEVQSSLNWNVKSSALKRIHIISNARHNKCAGQMQWRMSQRNPTEHNHFRE